MEMCPDAPSFLDYLSGWFNGERGPLNVLAISGLSLLLTLGTLIVIAVARA